MIAVLLSRIHPTTLRIDGAGGDDGRDVQFLDDGGGLHVFELKSFTGRVKGSRRSQIKRSVERARQLRATSWDLVVPIDPTPDEEKWFHGLSQELPFPIVWRGRTWLDAEMGSRPEIHRYFVERASDEVVRLLAELRAENAQLLTVTDAVARLRSLHERLNELDPHYTYEMAIGREATAGPHSAMLSVSFGNARVDVYPRYAGADRDRPITIEVQFVFGPDDANLQDKFLRAINYGAPVSLSGPVIEQVTIDAPGGLGATLSGGMFEIGPSRPRLADPVRVVAEVADGAQVLAALPLEFELRHSGRRGFVLAGGDASHWLKATLAVDTEAKTFAFTFGIAQTAVLPATALPLLRWLAHVREPNEMRLRSPRWSDPTPTRLTNEGLVDEEFVRLVEALDEVQRLTHVYFDLPFDLTPTESRAINSARALLSGETVHERWTSSARIELTLAEEVRRAVEGLIASARVALLLEQDDELQIREHRVPLGRVRTMIESARLANADAVRQQLDSQTRTVELELVPGNGHRVTRQRVSRE
jgi:hypothetical protein